MNSKKQNTLEEIVKEIQKANKIFLFSHVSPDGDGMGASIALQTALKKLGKEAYVIMEDEVPEFINFLANDACVDPAQWPKDPELCIAVDCADVRRFLKRQPLFFSGSVTVNIDHHESNDYFADVNYVKADSASASEIVFQLIKALDVPIDKEIATAIYVGISTDTGSFQYANTNAGTHLTAAALCKSGIDIVKINNNLFQSDSLARRKLIGKMLDTMEILEDGKVSIGYITTQMIAKVGANIGDTEGSVDEIRKVKGVEVAVLLKEIDEKTTKVSLRSKQFVDVNRIAAKFGGGGHKRAAGCKINSSIQEAKFFLMKELQGLNWNEWNNQLK